MQSDTPHKRGKPFPPGNRFGKGRPHGSRNKATLALEQLLDGEGEAIMRKLIQLAKKGDGTALRLCMERLCPPRRERPIKLEMPEIKTSDDIHAAFGTVVQEMAQGNITTDQAEHLTNVLEFGRKSIETQELAQRLAVVESQMKEVQSHERLAA